MRNIYLWVVAMVAACDVPPKTSAVTSSQGESDFGISVLSAGNNNDWYSNYCQTYDTFCRLSGNSTTSVITGIDEVTYGYSGVELRLYNDGAYPIVVANNSSASSATSPANRITTHDGSDVVISPGYYMDVVTWMDWTTSPSTPMGWREVVDNSMGDITHTTPTRTLGSAFQPNISRPVYACYSVAIDWAITVSGGQSGRVELLTDSANPPTAIRGAVAAGLTGTVVLGVTMAGTGGGQLCAMVKPGDYVLLRSVNVTGTPTYTVTRQTESVL